MKREKQPRATGATTMRSELCLNVAYNVQWGGRGGRWGDGGGVQAESDRCDKSRNFVRLVAVESCRWVSVSPTTPAF